MPDFDRGFKIAADAAGPSLAELAGLHCDAWESAEIDIQTAERLADRVFRAKIGRERFVVYVEAYSTWKKDAPWNMLAKSGLLSERERLPAVCLVFILTPKRYRPTAGTFRLELNSEPTQQLWYREVRMWEQDVRPEWERQPGLMALSPLCRQDLKPEEGVAFARNAISRQVSDRTQRANLLTTLAIFGKLSHPEIDPLKIIGREAMRESKFLQDYEDLIRVETKRADVLEVLVVRFGSERTEGFAEAINAFDDLDELQELHHVAIKCRRPSEFRKALEQYSHAKS